MPENQFSLDFDQNQSFKNKYSIAQYWALKALSKIDWKRIRISYDFSYSEYGFLGLENIRKKVDGSKTIGEEQRHIIEAIKENINLIESNMPEINPVLINNINKLSNVISLNKTQKLLLAFVVTVDSTKMLSSILGKFKDIKMIDIYKLLSFVLNLPFKEIKTNLSQESILLQSGLLSIKSVNDFMESCFNIELMNELSDRLLTPDIDINEIFEPYFFPSNKSKLTIADFGYLEQEITIINGILNCIKEKPEKGINILVYGPPGTGKTEFVRTIADFMGFHLYEIAFKKVNGSPVQGIRRFSALRLAQYVLNKKNTLVFFDEADDVFPENNNHVSGRSGYEQSSKLWINNLLENNNTPCIWVANNVDNLHEAYKRRFKYVLKMNIPPRNVRLNLLKKALKTLSVSSQWLNNASENTDLSPALISQASEITSLVNKGIRLSKSPGCSQTKEKSNEEYLTQILNNSLYLMNKKQIRPQTYSYQISYNINALNPDRNLNEVIEGLAECQEGRICLYGPPGTGKTALGHHISRQLNRQLIKKKASDIISPWVGETEANIARMFEESKDENAILLLDEADSFLMQRTMAQHNWEVTQVNELLTQMENHDGIFICSTNLMDYFDPASIRRFDLKIKLDYLQPEQAWLLFQQIVSDLGITLTQRDNWKHQLRQLKNLTPGDFTTAVRQTRLSNKKLEPEYLLRSLKHESDFKCIKQRGIGFTSEVL